MVSIWISCFLLAVLPPLLCLQRFSHPIFSWHVFITSQLLFWPSFVFLQWYPAGSWGSFCKIRLKVYFILLETYVVWNNGKLTCLLEHTLHDEVNCWSSTLAYLLTLSHAHYHVVHVKISSKTATIHPIRSSLGQDLLPYTTHWALIAFMLPCPSTFHPNTNCWIRNDAELLPSWTSRMVLAPYRLNKRYFSTFHGRRW